MYVMDTDLGSLIFFNDVSPSTLETSTPIEWEEEGESTKKQEDIEKK